MEWPILLMAAIAYVSALDVATMKSTFPDQGDGDDEDVEDLDDHCYKIPGRTCLQLFGIIMGTTLGAIGLVAFLFGVYAIFYYCAIRNWPNPYSCARLHEARRILRQRQRDREADGLLDAEAGDAGIDTRKREVEEGKSMAIILRSFPEVLEVVVSCRTSRGWIGLQEVEDD